MAGPIFADRVKQTSTTTGTGTLSLNASIASTYKSFVSQVGTTNTCYFCVANEAADEWEISLGTVTSGTPDTLSRTTVLASSTGSAVSFSAGTKDVFLVNPSTYGIPLIQIPTTFALKIANETILSATAGNARGTGAVDLQMQRSSATKVSSGTYATISGGNNNTSSGSNSTVGGGSGNAATGNNSTIGGGNGNSASAKFGTVAGGLQCTANQAYATVGGGYINVAGPYAAIAGGFRNAAAGTSAFVGAGGHNSASASYSVAAGGKSNTASASYAAVGGGKSNTASVAYAVVIGGFTNQATATGSAVLGGLRGVADKYGQQVQASGLFSANGDAQSSSFISRASTTNSTQTEMFLDGSSARMTMNNNTTWAFTISLVARRTDATAENAAFYIQGAIRRDANAASTTIVGSVTTTVVARDDAAWTVATDADTTNGSLRIRVTGETAKNIQWVANVCTCETTH